MRCKNCGAELPEDARVCRKCGSDVTPDMSLKELEKDNPTANTTLQQTDGAFPDNSDNPADYSEDPDNLNRQILEQLSGEDVVTGINVNNNQLEAFEHGKPLTFIAGEEDGGGKGGSRKKKARKAAKIPKEKPPKPPKYRRPRKAKVIRPKVARSHSLIALLTTKLRIPVIVLHIAVLICVAAAMFILGYVTHYYGENLQYETETNRQAIAALNVLMQTLPAESSFQADDLYVKSGSSKTEVIIFGEYTQLSDNGNKTTFRVLKENNEYTVYYPFDETLYNLLKDSEDAADRIAAAAMKAHEASLNRGLRELSDDSPMWQQADSPYVCYVVYRNYPKNSNAAK
jgi:hypothetical protein